MKRISILIAVLALGTPSPLRSQDAATEERLNRLSGQIENLIEAQRTQQKQIDALVKEIQSLRDQANRPTASYATQEDLKKIAEAVKEVDRKRIEDADRISTQLSKLSQKLTTPLPPTKKSAPPASSSASSTEKANEKGYPYTIRQGDTLSVIVQAYREKNIKITTDQILKANPGLKPDKLKVGQEIWIPAPQS